VWALAAMLPQKRRRRGGGEDSDSDEEDSDELPAYMFRMGLCESPVEIGIVVSSSKCDEHISRCGVEPSCMASCHKLFREKMDSQLESNVLAHIQYAGERTEFFQPIGSPALMTAVCLQQERRTFGLAS